MNLIKISIIFITLVVLLSNLTAIDEKGVKIGLNYSTISGNKIINAEFSPNFTTGLFVNKRLNNWLVIQPELIFSSKGSYYDGKEKIFIDNDADGEFDEDPFDLLDNDSDGLIDEDRVELDFNVSGYYKLNYLEVPILFQASTLNSVSSNLALFFGPSINVLINGYYKLKQDGYEYQKGNLSALNTFDFSVVLGFIYSAGKYKIELRANQSFIENNFKSAGEVIMESVKYQEEIFGPTVGDDYLNYCKFEKINGYNTAISLFVIFLF